MTNISSYNLTMPPSPRAMMDSHIGKAVETGSLPQVDGDTLESALDSIDSAIAFSASQNGASRLDPSEMKDRVDSLIADQVAAGTLTDDQAATLQGLFAQGDGPGGLQGTNDGADAMSVDGMQAMGATGGAHGMRGPPPPPSDSSGDDSATASADASATSAADQLDSMIAFLQNLRASLSSSLYGGTTGANDSSNSGLILDSMA